MDICISVCVVEVWLLLIVEEVCNKTEKRNKLMSDGKSRFITQWSARHYCHYCHSKERESCVCAIDGKLSTYISCGGKFEQNMCRKIPFVYMCMYIFTWTELSGRSFSLCLQGKGKGFPFYFKSFST